MDLKKPNKRPLASHLMAIKNQEKSHTQTNLEKDPLQSMTFQKFKWGLIDNQIWKKTFCKFWPSEKSKVL